MQHVVVIGAGQAGSSLVAKLRKEGFKGDITLIGAEKEPPYQRPPLSKKYRLGEMELKRLYLRPHSFYNQNGIRLMLGAQVTSVDPVKKAVTCEGQSLGYDELVLTTGAAPRRLPAAIGGDLPGVFYLRDLDHIDSMAPEFLPGRHVLIVGGGYIGLEAAAVAALKGLNVTLLEMTDRILQRVAAPQTSDFFRDLHTGYGVEILEGVGLKALTGPGRVRMARLTNGSELPVDFVIAGIGISPRTGLAEMAGVAIDNGIRTDAFGRTSVPHIWSAGDCASFPYRDLRIRLESVPNAIDQAELVAENLMGKEKTYSAKPWFWSDQYDVKLQIAGLNAGYDNVIVRKGEGNSISFWYYKGNDLLAVDAVNAPREYMIGKRLIENLKSPARVSVSDPDANLAGIMNTLLAG